MKPKYRYLSDASVLSAGETINGPARILDLKGRTGIHPTSIHTAIKLEGGHTFNQPKGTLVLWFFALEDLAASFTADHMKMSNEFFDFYTFLSDYEVPRDYPKGNFCFVWNRFNEFRAKFFKGTIYPTHEGFEPPQKAWVQAVPFNYFQQHRWYQLSVTWNDEAKSASLFVNGVHCGKSDIFNKDFYRDKVGDALYAGSPALCHGEIEFYNEGLDLGQHPHALGAASVGAHRRRADRAGIPPALARPAGLERGGEGRLPRGHRASFLYRLHNLAHAIPEHAGGDDAGYRRAHEHRIDLLLLWHGRRLSRHLGLENHKVPRLQQPNHRRTRLVARHADSRAAARRCHPCARSAPGLPDQGTDPVFIAKQAKEPFWPTVKSTFTNEAFRILASFALIFGFGINLVQGQIPYLRTYYVLKGDEVFSATIGGVEGSISMVLGMLSIPFFRWLCKRIGKKQTLMTATSIILVATWLSWFTYTPQYPWLAMVTGILLSRYPLSHKRMEEMRAELEARRGRL